MEDATEKKRKALDDARTALLAQERLKALEALEHETTALRLVHEVLRSGMWTMEFDQKGQMASVCWSPEFRAMIGYHDEKDFPDALSSWTDLLHAQDRSRVIEEYYAAIDDYTGKRILDVEYRLLTKDRGYRWFRSTGKLSRREDGTPITYVGMFVDITRRKEADEKFRSSTSCWRRPWRRPSGLPGQNQVPQQHVPRHPNPHERHHRLYQSCRHPSG